MPRKLILTAINLALRNLYGYVIWGDTLANQRRLVYRTGFNLRGIVQEIPLEHCPAPVQDAAARSPPCTTPTGPNDDDFPMSDNKPAMPGRQQHLF